MLSDTGARIALDIGVDIARGYVRVHVQPARLTDSPVPFPGNSGNIIR